RSTPFPYTTLFRSLYYGCSLGALQHLAHQKGYILLGSNILGHNAFFLRSDIVGEFQPVPLERAYVRSQFRESRNQSGQLTYVREEDRVKLIEHLPVVNVITGVGAPLRDSLI